MNTLISTAGYQKFQDMGKRLKVRQSAKKGIDEMSYAELDQKAKKYRSWAIKNPTHEDYAMQTHIYEHYVLPRLHELTLEHHVETTLCTLSYTDLQEKGV